MGVAFKVQGKLDEAIACFERVLQLEADDVNAHINRSLVWLLRGDFERGWDEYEWRWEHKDSLPRQCPQRLWDGSSLAGRTILLHAEQGLGDTIQFIRYAPLVKRCGGTVVVGCSKLLTRLLATCSGIDRVVTKEDSLPEFDVHAPLLSLPRIFQTHLDSIPADIPYLQSLEKCRPEIENLLSAQQVKHRVGIVWAGNPDHPNDRNRSCALSCFRVLTCLPDVALFSLQKGANGADLERECREMSVIDLSEVLDDFAETAAAVMKLDLVITVDTAVAHLAGALGRPVWVLLPFAPDWRWLLDREDSSWYPTMRLFRQPRPGDWEAVFERVTRALVNLNRHDKKCAHETN